DGEDRRTGDSQGPIDRVETLTDPGVGAEVDDVGVSDPGSSALAAVEGVGDAGHGVAEPGYVIDFEGVEVGGDPPGDAQVGAPELAHHGRPGGDERHVHRVAGAGDGALDHHDVVLPGNVVHVIEREHPDHGSLVGLRPVACGQDERVTDVDAQGPGDGHRYCDLGGAIVGRPSALGEGGQLVDSLDVPDLGQVGLPAV